jgi:hypothetical protein
MGGSWLPLTPPVGTDLWIRTDAETEILLYFCEQNKDNTSTQPVTFELGRSEKIVYFEDVLDHFLDLGERSWVGAIHYESVQNVQVYARVYSISSDGRESYGQLVEGIPTADMSPAAGATSTRDYQWMFAAKHTADGRYRVNVGIVNPTPFAGHFGVSMFTAGGDGTGSGIDVQVPPYSMTQLADPFGDRLGGEWNNCIIRVGTVDTVGGYFGYLSVVDNATNDAYFVRGVKLWPPDHE